MNVLPGKILVPDSLLANGIKDSAAPLSVPETCRFDLGLHRLSRKGMRKSATPQGPTCNGPGRQGEPLGSASIADGHARRGVVLALGNIAHLLVHQLCFRGNVSVQ